MPRDFVPCEYTERELSNPVTDETIKRCQVIECFEGVHLVTRGILFTVSLDEPRLSSGYALGHGR